jgi:hypothetical protein
MTDIAAAVAVAVTVVVMVAVAVMVAEIITVSITDRDVAAATSSHMKSGPARFRNSLTGKEGF